MRIPLPSFLRRSRDSQGTARETATKQPDWRRELGLQPGERPDPMLIMSLLGRANGLANHILAPWDPDFAEPARIAQRQLDQIQREYSPRPQQERK